MQRQAKQQVSRITGISFIVILRLFRCVFSAATSSGQTFRIGKSITNAEGTVPNPTLLNFIALHCFMPADKFADEDFRYFEIPCSGTDFHICSLPHDSGSCDRKEFRYFYNSLEVRILSKASLSKPCSSSRGAASCLCMAAARATRTTS